MASSKRAREGRKSNHGKQKPRPRAERRQRDVVRLLQAKSTTSRLSKKLEKCRPETCGADRCVEVCWLGHRRRCLDQLPGIKRLFKAAKVLEVRLVCGDWSRPFGRLDSLNVKVVTRRIRTLFDSFYNTGIVAVGMLKVAASPFESVGWVCEAHMLVAGVPATELEHLFGKQRSAKRFENRWQVTSVAELDEAISHVLERTLKYWQDPVGGDDIGRVPKKHRRELYSWQSRIRAGMCIVRYGCDRYFNRLAKKPRKFVRKGMRKRIYPTWLTGHMFGGDKWQDREPPMPRLGTRSRLRSDYYDDLDSDIAVTRRDPFKDLDKLA